MVRLRLIHSNHLIEARMSDKSSDHRAISELQREFRKLQTQLLVYQSGVDQDQIPITVDQWNQKDHKYIRVVTLGFTKVMLISIPDRNTNSAIFTCFARVGDVLKYHVYVPVRKTVEMIVRSIDPFRGIVWLMNTSGVVTKSVQFAHTQNITISPSIRQNWNPRGTPVIFPTIKVRYLEEECNTSRVMGSDNCITNFVPSHRCNVLGSVDNVAFKGFIVENWSKTQMFFLTTSECRARINIPIGSPESMVCRIERLVDSNCSISIGDQVAIHSTVNDAALASGQSQIGEVVEIISHRHIFYNYWVMVDVVVDGVKKRRCVLNRILRIVKRGYRWNNAFTPPTVCHQWILLENTTTPHDHFPNGTKVGIAGNSALWSVCGCFTQGNPHSDTVGDTVGDTQILVESITNPYRDEESKSGFEYIDTLTDEWRVVRNVSVSSIVHYIPPGITHTSSSTSSISPSPTSSSSVSLTSLIMPAEATDGTRIVNVVYPADRAFTATESDDVADSSIPSPPTPPIPPTLPTLPTPPTLVVDVTSTTSRKVVSPTKTRKRKHTSTDTASKRQRKDKDRL